MIEVKIPKEITEYQEKFLFGLTLRQSISLALSMGLAFFIYKFSANGNIYDIEIDSLTTIIALIVVPILAFGFITFEDITLEKYLYLFIKFLFIVPRNRKYSEIDYLSEVSIESLPEYEKLKKLNKKKKKKEEKKERKTKI